MLLTPHSSLLTPSQLIRVDLDGSMVSQLSYKIPPFIGTEGT
jgi:hypothetical protein